MMKHIVPWNWIIRLSDIVSVVRVMLASCELARDQQRQGSLLKVDGVGNKFVLKNFRRWLIPVLRPSSSLLVKGSWLVYVGGPPVMTYLRRLSSKGVSLSGIRYNYERIGTSQVKVYLWFRLSILLVLKCCWKALIHSLQPEFMRGFCNIV